MRRADYNRTALAGLMTEPLEPRQLLAAFVVSTNADSGAGSLRQAVLDANANGTGADTITFTAAGPINLTSTELLVNSDLTITGPANRITISGQDARRIFNVANGRTTTFTNLRLIDGFGPPSGAGTVADGGAIRAGGGNVTTVNNCVFDSNTAQDGAAISSGDLVGTVFTFSTLNVNNSTFTNGNAVEDLGGSARGGAIQAFGRMFVTNSDFINNTAVDTNSRGGAVYMVGDDPIASPGGGSNGVGGTFVDGKRMALADGTTAFLQDDGENPAGTESLAGANVVLSNCEFIDNSATALGGAFGVFQAKMQINDTTFRGNGGGAGGGGLWIEGPSLFIERSAFIENDAATTGFGAAINIQNANNTLNLTMEVDIVNSTIADNTGPNRGGLSINTFGDGITPRIVNVEFSQTTITRNVDRGIVAQTPAFADEINLLFVNSILAGNFDAAGVNDTFDIGTTADATLNIFVAGINLFGTAFTPQPEIIVADDALLSAPTVSPSSNGTPVLLPLPGSPVLDAGDSAAAVDPGLDNELLTADDVVLTTDQRGPGFPRIVGAAVDIGAAEAGGADVDPPSVSAAAFGFQTRQTVSFTFDEDINPASIQLADLVLRNDDLAGNPVVPTPAGTTFVYDAGTRTLTFTFNPAGGLAGTLPRGNYEAILPAGSVTDTAGNGLAPQGKLEFFVTPGDANRDRTVNLADFGIVRTNFGQSGRTFGQGDFNYDGTVNLADFGILRANFGTTLAPPSPDDLFGGGNGGGDDDDGRDFF